MYASDSLSLSCFSTFCHNGSKACCTSSFSHTLCQEPVSFVGWMINLSLVLGAYFNCNSVHMYIYLIKKLANVSWFQRCDSGD